MMKAYATAGFVVVNPFEGQLLRRIELKPYTPLPRELLDSIWTDSANSATAIRMRLLRSNLRRKRSHGDARK